MFRPLARISTSSADDADILAPFDVGHNQNSSARGNADHDEALFFFGMIRIGNRDRLPVREDSHRFVEAHAMLAEIAGCLPGIPLELHWGSVPSTCSWRLTYHAFSRERPPGAEAGAARR